MKHHEAPWSRTLVLGSVLVVVVCLGLSAILLCEAAEKSYPASFCCLALVPLLILLGAVPFMIRGYSIGSDCILVHRLLWSTVLPRAGLESAWAEPVAMRGSIRTFGNGGAFSFTGWYYNRRLGSYRAFVTDPGRAVVLRYASRRVVLSPAKPEEFVQDLALVRP
jgi:hypothetical protein